MASLEEYNRYLTGGTESQREYRTIEVWHPQLDQVYRFVSAYKDVILTLESTSPRNAGEAVTFRGVTMQITEPAERQDSEQSISIQFGNVDSTIHEIIDQISGQGYLSQAEVVYRKYYSGNLTQPAVSPLYLFASNISFDDTSAVSIVAEDTDLSQKRSGTVYDTTTFKGLAE